MKKLCYFFSFIVCLFTANLFADSNALEPQASSVTLGVLVPFYIDPSPSAIQPLINAAQANPNVPIRVILNPNNGVGSRKSSVYVNGSAALKHANISTSGYIYTSSGNRPLADVKQEISTWVSWYNPDGIFLDEMANNADHAYYSAITAYAKSLGIQYVIGNPGDNDVPTSVGNDVDTIIVYENKGLPKHLTQFNKWSAAGYTPNKIGLITYGISTLPTSFISQAAPIFGWIYVTNKGSSNPYNGLPSYWSNLVSDISSLNH